MLFLCPNYVHTCIDSVHVLKETVLPLVKTATCNAMQFGRIVSLFFPPLTNVHFIARTSSSDGISIEYLLEGPIYPNSAAAMYLTAERTSLKKIWT
jgi:hypothetical protein